MVAAMIARVAHIPAGRRRRLALLILWVGEVVSPGCM